MKKFTLFFVAIFAMINVANAQRAWAYDLELTSSADSYTFAFKAVTAGDATLVFYKEGAEAGTLNLGSVSAGDNTVTKTSEELLGAIQQSGDFNWGVKMTGSAIGLNAKGFTLEVTDVDRGIYNFYLPQGVAVDNNPESSTFGKIYIAEATNGASDGGSNRADNQKRGIFIYDQTLAELNPTSNVGIIPSNVTLADASRHAMHRIAVNPVNGHVAFAYNIAGSTAVWSVDPNNLAGEATNLIAGLGITKANSICFDEDGVLYVMDNGNTSTGGTLVKIKNGALTKIVQNAIWGVEDNAIVSDGRGGIWIAQHRSAIDDYAVLSHVNAAGAIDFKVTNASATALQNLFPTANGNASYRGQCAYNTREDLLAFGGNYRSSVYKVTYDAETGIPSLALSYRTPYLSKNIDGLAFDYAGDLYLLSASAERFYKYSAPTNNNTCTVPAKKAQVITLVSAIPEYNVTINVNGNGTVTGANTGKYLEGTELTLTATPAEHHDFINWTGDITSTDNPLTITVNSDINITANFQEHTKYTITASAADNTMGYVTGGGTYYAGETVTLTAVAKSTYYFVNWSDGNTNATRTFPASANLTLTANFAKANPRAWAYDLKMVEEGDNYKFFFTATTTANATLLFLDKEGNELYLAHDIGAVAAGANIVSIEKSYFTKVKDVYWSVKMDGEAIPAISEITDQSRGIYDFYNMMGVVVDNDPNSKDFGKIYIQQSFEYTSGTTADRNKTQKAGIFIYDQGLNELNPTNVGYKPTMPTGYTAIGKSRESFKRLAINPTNGNLVFGNNISGEGSVWTIGRDNLTAEATNIIEGVTGIDKVNAICYDENGSLYVLANITTGSAKYNLYKFTAGVQTELTLGGAKVFVDADVAMTSDGRGGLWIAQRRGGITQYSILSHVNVAEDKVDFVLDSSADYATWFSGNCYRAAIAYNAAESIVAVQGASKILLFKVSYDALTGAPSISKYLQVSPVGSSVDGLVFDYAGDLYTVNSGSEKFQKFTLPTADNICTVPAPKSQAIVKEIRHTVTTNTTGNGTVIGAGEYVEGETATLIASPAAHHQFVNWTFDDETTSTDNPLEIVVNSDITVTAHFEPIQYTVVALTNDENKGTVSGAGAYNYGTEVTLTATPKPGYKLLYWSDRTTENPRTITMTKNETISAYFVKEYAVEPTFTIEKVWENTNVPAATADGYQAVGWDGQVYMQNKTAGQIQVFSNGTDAPTNYAVSNTNGQQIAIDEAGNMIVFNAYFATATPTAIQIYKKGSTTAKAVTFTLKDPARCDFFSASGDIYSAEGGYVYFYCAGKTVINRLKITNGAATAADVTTDVVGEAVYSSPQNTNYVMVDIFGNLVAHARSNAINAINVYTNESKAFTLPSIKMGTLGGCSFELGGKELWAYHAGASNYSSEWNIYNMTDSKFLSDDDFYAVDKEATTNNACNWLNVQIVDENTAYIYQFCPKKAVAVWKVTMHEVVLRDTTNNEKLLTDLNGSTTNVSVYRSLTGGMYNTLCLPFDVNELTGTPLENATVWQYNRATVKVDGTNKEIFLEFDEVESITAGEPYLVEPAEDIAAPMEFKNVTISVTNGNDVAQDAVTMYGILHPTELQANDKSILFLVENNNLAWANETANMNGMRAYFKVNEPSLLSARTRAYIRREPTVATDMENITTSETEIKKVIYNGTLYIIRGDEVYTIQGTKVK